MIQGALAQSGVVHLRQAIPRVLIRQLRCEIAQLLARRCGQPPSWWGGIDRQAVRLFTQDPAVLAGLDRELEALPAFYALALQSGWRFLLAEQAGWSRACLSPIHNLRAKLPWCLSQNPFTNVPWHQDYGATDPADESVALVTAWVPITQASPHHGGLQVIPGSHRLGWLPHRRGEHGPEVCADGLAIRMAQHLDLQPLSINARPGDVVLFDQFTLHRGLPNQSNRCRWSLDLRYAEAGHSSGRRGLWRRDPLVGEAVDTTVMDLVRERLSALADPATVLHKRVDVDSV